MLDHVKEFLQAQKPNTQKTYRFLLELSDKGLDEDNFNELAESKNGSKNTYNTKLAALKSFCMGRGIDNGVLDIPRKKGVVVASHEKLTTYEYMHLKNYCQQNHSKYTRAIGLLMSTGIRYSELSQIGDLSKSDVIYNNLKEPKTGRIRKVLIPRDTTGLIEKKYPMPSQVMINKFIKEMFDFNLKTITCHSLRGSYITFMYNQGMEPLELCIIIGKVDINGKPLYDSMLQYLTIDSSNAIYNAQNLLNSTFVAGDTIADIKKQNKHLRMKLAQAEEKNKALLEGYGSVLSTYAEEMHEQFAKDTNDFSWKDKE